MTSEYFKKILLNDILKIVGIYTKVFIKVTNLVK